MFGEVSKEINKTFVPDAKLSKGSVIRIMHQDLHLFPYKKQILQFQSDANKAERRAFGQTISQLIEDHPNFWTLFFIATRQNSTSVVT